MLIRGKGNDAVFLNPAQIAWVAVEEGGRVVRLMYANGRPGDLNAQHFGDDQVLVAFLREITADPDRFTPVMGGRQFLNLGHVHKVVLSERSARVFFPDGNNREFAGEDLRAIRERLARG